MGFVGVLFSSPLPGTTPRKCRKSDRAAVRQDTLRNVQQKSAQQVEELQEIFQQAGLDQQHQPRCADSALLPGSQEGNSVLRTRAIRYREEITAVELGLEGSNIQLEKVVATSATLLDVVSSNSNIELLHFIGFGVEPGGLLVETNKGFQHPLVDKELRRLVNPSHMPCVLLSSHGDQFGTEAAQTFQSIGAPIVIHLRSANMAFITEFYRQLGTYPLHVGLKDSVLKAQQAVEAQFPVDLNIFINQQLLENRETKINDFDVILNLEPQGAFRHQGRIEQPGVRQNFAPPPPANFLGRTSALCDLCSLFVSEDNKGVVLSGVQGSGKSSLAFHAAQFAFERGLVRRVYYVDCRDIKKPKCIVAKESGLGKTSWDLNIVENLLWVFQLLAKPFEREVNLLAALVQDLGNFEGETTELGTWNALEQLTKEAVAQNRPQELVQRLVMVLQGRISVDRHLVILDNCEGPALSNHFFKETLLLVLTHIRATLLCCSTHFVPFDDCEHFFDIKLEGMTLDDANFMLQNLAPKNSIEERKAVISHLQRNELCLPSSIHTFANLLVSVPSGSKVDFHKMEEVVKCDVRNRIFQDLEYFLVLVSSKEIANAGVKFWKDCTKRYQKTPTHIDIQSFKDALQVNFRQSGLPGCIERPLSQQTCNSLMMNLTRVSPVTLECKQLVSMSRFAVRFWPWWMEVLTVIKFLGADPASSATHPPLWARRVRGKFPVIWIDSRGGAAERLKDQPVGVFTLRFSESCPRSLAIEFVRPSSEICSSLLSLREGVLYNGRKSFKSLSAAILSDSDLKFILGNDLAVKKEDIFTNIP